MVGVIVTTVFGFLPTLTAGQVRPGVVLRPSDAVIPKAGRGADAVIAALIILVLSLIAQTILGSFTTALALVVGAFFAAGLLYLLLILLIWLIGRFVPSFGIIDLKLSLRQMLAGRGRASMTLLALVDRRLLAQHDHAAGGFVQQPALVLAGITPAAAT